MSQINQNAYVDMAVPQPFLDPEAWPNALRKRTETWLISFDLLFHTAGALRRWADEARRSGPTVLRLSPELYVNPLIQKECKAQLEQWVRDSRDSLKFIEVNHHLPLDKLDRLQHELFQDLAPLRYRQITTPRDASRELEDWASVVFTKTRALVIKDMGDLQFRRLLTEFNEQLAEVLVFPWSRLGLVPGFLRRRFGACEIVEVSTLEWTRSQVLHSPLNDQSLNKDGFLLNPTTQFVRLREGTQEAELIAISRLHSKLHEYQLSMDDASICDELHENGSMTREDLRSALSRWELEHLEERLSCLKMAGVILDSTHPTD